MIYVVATYIGQVLGPVEDSDQSANHRTVYRHVREDGGRMVDCSRSHGALLASSAALSTSKASEAIPERADAVGGAIGSPDRESVNGHTLQWRVEEVKGAATTTEKRRLEKERR